MSYIYVSPLGVIQESKEIENLIKEIVLNSANEPELERQLNDKSLFNKKKLNKPPADKIKRIRKAAVAIARLIIGQMINMFTANLLKKCTINTMERTQANKQLYDFIQTQIDAAYKKHPNYFPCSIERFANSNMFELMQAKFEDKTKKQKMKIITLELIDRFIDEIISKSIKLPGQFLWITIVKMILTYCGVYLTLGTLYNYAFNIKGEMISIGIMLRPMGFVLSKLTLYSLKPGDKLVATPLATPPEKLYQLTVESAKQILAKFKSDDADDLKKEVARIYAGK